MELEKQLIQACIDGDRRSQHRLYKDCFQLLMSVCSRYKSNREDCMEILNQGFFKILINLSKYKDNIPFEAWARRIMINCLIDDYRKRKRELSVIEYHDLNGHDHSFHQSDWNEAEKIFDAQDIEKMITQLPEKTRTVFNMYAIDGYQHKEIAELLEISINTSKWHLSDARKKLQKMIQSKFVQSKTVRYGQ